MQDEDILRNALIDATREDIANLEEKYSSIVNDFPIEIDITGTPICPGHPKICLGSGEFPGFPLCCDECDYLGECFPNWRD